MNSPKDDLKRLLSSDEGGHIQAVKALQKAFEWCASMVTGSKIPTRGAAISLLLETNKAMEAGNKYLSLIPEIIQKNEPGKILKDFLEQNKKQLDDKSEEISRLKAELELIFQRENELHVQMKQLEDLKKQRDAQSIKLQNQKAELERLTLLTRSGDLEELQRQVKELEQYLPPEANETKRLEDIIGERSRNLLIVSEERLKNMQEEIGRLLTSSEEKRKEIMELTQKLQDAHSRYDNMQDEIKQKKEELEPYLKADQIVAKALPNARSIQDMLDKAKELIAEAEKAMKAIIEAEQARISSIQDRPFTLGG